MPTNVSVEYSVAEAKSHKANTTEEKLACLQEMLRFAPSHKGSENLRSDIKQKIAKLKEKQEKESKKKGGYSIAIKREGAAQVLLVGSANSGKSTLLKKLTGANVEIAPYPFTTIKPEIGMMDYKGIKIQVVEMPAITENFEKSTNGKAYRGIIKQADLIVLLFNTPEEYKMLQDELYNIEVKKIIYNPNSDVVGDIWRALSLIKVYTKEPGKEPAYPPVAFKHGATIADVAHTIHKDLLRKFKFAKVWGKSVKFKGVSCGPNHILEDEDIVEIHAK